MLNECSKQNQLNDFLALSFPDSLKDLLVKSQLNLWAHALPELIEKTAYPRKHGMLEVWTKALLELPKCTPSSLNIDQDIVSVGAKSDLTTEQHQQLFETLSTTFHPWRKGPFEVFGLHIDTEWRSDLKWQRLVNKIEPLKNRRVLDVGCGSGYHMWRSYAEGASIVVGADPSQFFMMQFNLIKQLISSASDDTSLPVYYLPLKSEELPLFDSENAHFGFDTVFSMGVLYHRKSLVNHLIELKRLLRPKGELVLETLVIEGDDQTVLMPEDRYAKMRNVWSIPSVAFLEKLLKRLGFKFVEVVDISFTTIEEQRKTDWMRFESLADFLKPGDATQTIEGYPAPMRAVFRCQA